MDHSTSLYGGIGRYHSRLVWPAPGPALSGGATLRFIVFAPPLPKVSYIRIIPLWFDDMKARYPGDHTSTKPCVHTPGIPYLIICAISKLENQGNSPYRIGSSAGCCGAWPLKVYMNGTDSCRSCMIGGCHCKYQSSRFRIVTCE